MCVQYLFCGVLLNPSKYNESFVLCALNDWQHNESSKLRPNEESVIDIGHKTLL